MVLKAGDGFIAQSSKWLHFGLGDGRVRKALVHWPGGETETFTGLSRGKWYRLVQGSAETIAWEPPSRSIALRPSVPTPTKASQAARVLLPARIPMPALPYTDFDGGTPRKVESASRLQLVNFWASWCAPCVAELKELASHAPELREAGLDVLALSVDGLDEKAVTGPADAQRLLKRIGFDFGAGMATFALLDKIEQVQGFLFDRQPTFAVPFSLLMDGDQKLVAIYRGRVEVEVLLQDIASLEMTAEQRRVASVPFPGRWIKKPQPFNLKMLEPWFRDRYPADGLMYLGLALKQQEAFRSIVDRPETIDRAQAQIHLQVAEYYNRMGRPVAAIEHCRKSLGLDAKQAPAHMFLGELYQARGELAMAVETYEEALQIDPAQTAARYRLGLSHGKLGHYEKAREIFEQVTAARPNDAGAYLNLSSAHAALGEYDRAQAAAERALALATDEPQLADLVRQQLKQYGKLAGQTGD